MIDLHTHTTASDGRVSPPELAARAAAAGVTTLSVTDHDTVAGYAAAIPACAALSVTLVTGIEITSVVDETDVHVLGYFIDVDAPVLLAFLAEQRRRRVDRVREMIARLAAQGVALDADAILRPGLEDSGKAAGRPWIARALVAGGHAADVNEAFERWLVRGRTAFVARVGPSPAEVFGRIHEAGGLASLAHPGILSRDGLIPGFAADGLDAIEAYHSSHDGEQTAKYVALAGRLELGVTGGSDYHADDAHGSGGPGAVSLPAEHFARFAARLRS